MAETVIITPLISTDQIWVQALLIDQWGSEQIVSRGKILDASQLPGFKTVVDGINAGLVTYHFDQGDCEIVTLNSLVEGKGVGSGLIEAVKQIARENHCRRVWLITTNDNLNALRFYQKRGFTLAALYPNALSESRKLKPQISVIGMDGIPLRDEIELEIRLD